MLLRLQPNEISLRERRGAMQPVFRRIWSCYDFCYFLISIVNQEIKKKDLMIYRGKKFFEAKKGKMSAYFPWQQIFFFKY